MEENEYAKENKEKNINQDLKLFTNLKNIFKDHNGYFYPCYKDCFGLSIFVKKDLEILEEGEVIIYGGNKENHEHDHTRNMEFVKLNIDNRTINILNVHGLWTGKGKDDSEDRINQSQNIIDFIKTLNGEVVLCRDFNLNPDTESIKMIEEFGLKNLIRENNITSTRTSYYPKDRDSRFADYTFVSKDVEVKSFEIMPDEVSDHSAMKLIIKV
ncbi:MAG: hypothetical protein QG630_167 [Patescibacteria group bacterium]|nr:hypothetical protein [Patescibacteria group bacterium]